MLFLHFAFYTPTHGRWREPQKGWEGVTCSKASVLFFFFESHHLSAQTLTWLRDGAWSHTARLTLCCVVVFAASLAAASGSLLFFCSPGLWPQHSDAKSPWWHPRWLAEHPLLPLSGCTPYPPPPLPSNSGAIGFPVCSGWFLKEELCHKNWNTTFSSITALLVCIMQMGKYRADQR